MSTHVNEALEGLSSAEMLELCCAAVHRLPSLTQHQRKRILRAMALEVELPATWSPDSAPRDASPGPARPRAASPARPD